MVSNADSFVIDTTFLFEAAHRVVLGAPLLVVDDEDCTFVFCVIRDFLRLRQDFHICRGTVVVGEDAYHATSASNIGATVSFLQALGVPVLHDATCRVIDVCSVLASCAGRFVTRNPNLLVFAEGGRAVILNGAKNGSAVLDSKAVTSSFGISPEGIPAFLALTDGPPPTAIIRREAVGLLQRHPNLPKVLEDPSIVSSRRTRHKLRENKAQILDRIRQFTPNAAGWRPDSAVEQRPIDIDNKSSSELLRAHRFYSLVRLLPLPPLKPAPPPVGTTHSNFYQAVTTLDGIRSLVARIASAGVCAVDTESSGKDPHTAELFGVSFS